MGGWKVLVGGLESYVWRNEKRNERCGGISSPGHPNFILPLVEQIENTIFF